MGDWFFTLTGIHSIEDPPIWFPLIFNSDGLTRVTWFSLVLALLFALVQCGRMLT